MKKDFFTSLVDMVPESKQVGTPTMVLMPARHYYFEVSGQHKITIPRKGSYHELDPDFFSTDDGEFNLLDTENNALYLPAITKILFATKQYPDLKDTQFFAPVALFFEDDVVDVVGQIIELLPAKSANME